MKVKILGNPVVQGRGCLGKGRIFDESVLSRAMMEHLIQIGSAVEVGENKMEPTSSNKMETTPAPEKKSTAVTNASLSLPADQASQKKTRKRQKTTTSSQSTRTIK